jgi:hypothetical protein
LVVREVPITEVHLHPDFYRDLVPGEFDDDILLVSVREEGLVTPLVVAEESDGRYAVVDGCLRYACAKRLGFPTVPCVIHGPLPGIAFGRLRFRLNSTIKPWSRADARRYLEQLWQSATAASAEINENLKKRE